MKTNIILKIKSALNAAVNRVMTRIKKVPSGYVVVGQYGQGVDVMGEMMLSDLSMCVLKTRSEAKELRAKYLRGELLVKPDNDNYLYLIPFVIIGSFVALGVITFLKV